MRLYAHTRTGVLGDLNDKGWDSMPNEVVLSMRNISKSFSGVRALHNVDFTLNQGEIHALMARMEPENRP